MASGQPGTQQETNTTALANNGISRGQIIYATMVNYGQWAGLFVMIVTFLAYMSGLLPGLISPQEIAQNWHLSSGEYLRVTGGPTGWEWLGMLNYGDFLSLLGVSWLAGLTILAYLFILVPTYIKQKDVPFLTIVVVEVVVLVVAASGILGTGGH